MNKIVLVLAILMLFFGAGASAQPQPPPSVCELYNGKAAACLADAFPDSASGNQTIVVFATSDMNINASKFNIWFNGELLNWTNGGLISAKLGQNLYTKDNIDTIPLMNNVTNSGPLFITLNKSATLNMVQVNLTVDAPVYYPPSDPNDFKSGMFTINYLAINTSIPNTLMITFDNTTKTFGPAEGPAMTDDKGYYAQHCMGVVDAGACVGDKPFLGNNTCGVHGVRFYFGNQAPPFDCQINVTQSIYAYDFISSNMSEVINVTPGTPAQINLIKPVASAMPKTYILVSNPTGNIFEDANISSLDVYEYGTNNKVFSFGGIQGEENRMPTFLQQGKFYNISINISGFGVANYPLMFPLAGTTGFAIVAPNASDSELKYSIVYGKVVNESGAPVQGAIVYAQFYKGGGGDMTFFNSSITNANGVFSLRIPQTRWMLCGGPNPPSGCQWAWPVYQFAIISNITNPSTGAPLYFQTIDANDGYAYFIQSDVYYLPKPLVIKSGGQINVNITLNGASALISELSKLFGTGTGIERDAGAGKFTLLSMFDQVQLPESFNLIYFSPTGNVIMNFLGYNATAGGEGMWGDPLSISKICFNSSSVSQGQVNQSSCNLTRPGYLNLTIYTKSNIFNATEPASAKTAGDYNMWFENKGIIRDAATGNIVAYLDPEGMMMSFVLGFGGTGSNLIVPLPQGNYTIEIVPSFEWNNFMGVYNSTNISIVSGEKTAFSVVTSERWQINPMLNPSMILSDNNSIEAVVFYGPMGELNDSTVSLSARILYQNKTAASQFVPLTYNSTTRRFENKTFNPSQLGVSAGRYILLFNATNVTASGDRYTATMEMPMFAYDFQVGIDLGGFTFGTGQKISGQIFAFNRTGPVSNTSPIVVQMFDQTGTPLPDTAYSISVSSLVDGKAAINITLPSVIGFYNIITKVNASNKIGMAENWLQVSNFNIQTSTDRFRYNPEDIVYLTVKVSNASSNQPLNASVEVNVEGSSSPAVATTDDKGKATVVLDPAIYGAEGKWSFGWKNLHIKISVMSSDGNLQTVETFYGFDVRGIEMNIRPDRPSYSESDNVIIELFGQPGFTVSSVSVDGTSLSENMNCENPKAQQEYCLNDVDNAYKRINLLSGWSPGVHNVEIEAGTNEGKQTFYASFIISIYRINAFTDKFSYDLNENITLDVSVSYPNNGSAVANALVIATLYKAQPPNDIYVTNATGPTDESGRLSNLKLNATQAGFNYIKINVSNQLWFIGVMVSPLKVELQNENGEVVNEYRASAGGSVTIRVNASAAPDGSLVKAVVWAFGRPNELPTSTTTNGKADIVFTIPAEAPAQDYGLEVKVITPSGDVGVAPPAMLRVTGGSALQMEVTTDHSFMQPYMPGETGIFKAKLSYTNGTAVSGKIIEFTYDSVGAQPKILGNATTDTSGVATLSASVPASDGPYHLMAKVKGTDIEAHGGFLVASLDVGVVIDKAEYNPGDTMGINITVKNRTSGAPIAATGGFIAIFNEKKGEMNIPIQISGGQPYQVSIPIPDKPDVVGTYPMGIVIFSNRSQGIGFAMVDVVNTSRQINISVPASMVAGTEFSVDINSSIGTQADVAVFSPAASRVVYSNDNLALSGIPPSASIRLNLTYPGVYVIDVYVEGVGSKKKIITVSPPTTGAAPKIWTYTALSTDSATNTTAFTTSQDVYIMSNIGNTTATVMVKSTTTNTTKTISLPLNLVSGGVYYNVLSNSELVSGQPYFIRLDTNEASGIAATMFKVS